VFRSWSAWRNEPAATGGWIGVPPEVERIENLAVRQAPWQFQVYFVATSVQEPTSLAEQLRRKNCAGVHLRQAEG